MSRFIFLFDMDSTITRQEILPTIFRKIGIEDKMRGEIPFKQSFLQRVELLKDIPINEVNRMVGEIELNDKLVDFIAKYRDRCYIVTGNLDVWIDALVRKLGMEKNVFCSKAMVKDGYIRDVISIVDKNTVIRQMVLPFVAVGNSNDDAEMIEAAEIGIGYGGGCDIAPSVLACASHAIYEENRLVEFLQRLV